MRKLLLVDSVREKLISHINTNIKLHSLKIVRKMLDRRYRLRYNDSVNYPVGGARCAEDDAALQDQAILPCV